MQSVSLNAARRLFALALVASCAFAGAQAQTRDRHVISARAGAVNFASGDVRVKLQGQSSWQRLTDKDTLASGDTVQTGPGARAEILLNPGSYLRLGENAEFTLADDSLDALRLKLTAGSAVVEATGFDGLRVSIVVETPHTSAAVVKSGLYRFNVVPLSVTEVAVHKGRALVGRQPDALKLKGKRVARVSAGGVEQAKLDTKQKDELDLWSRQRAKTLAEANRKLSRRDVNALFARLNWFGYVSPAYGLRPGYPFGIWFFDVSRRCYTYLPGLYGVASPYGFGYDNSIYWNPYLRSADPRCGGCSARTAPTPVVVNTPSAGWSSPGASASPGNPVQVGSDGSLVWRVGDGRGGGGSPPAPAPATRAEPASAEPAGTWMRVPRREQP